ncbi:PEPxxWA-CTERM sorting domain-containing protein [uncultured Sphingomonas sp.]|uniref:PEPxxWA-CTERM sorting domain-containing protein n=1 Tax=uncultured Sphingomonas sp. TaxID=158754 RepID=UPI0035CC131B
MTALISAACAMFGAGGASAAEIVNERPVRGTLQISFFGPVGQSFVAFAPKLTSIGFGYRVSSSWLPIAPVTMNLYEGAGFTGNLVATRTFTPTAATNSIFDADFTGTALTVGSIYTAAVSTSNAYFGVAATPNNYDGGQAYTQLDLSDYPIGAGGGTLDLQFRIVAADSIAAVPEPASWALMILGFGMVGAGLRRRKPVIRGSAAFG